MEPCTLESKLQKLKKSNQRNVCILEETRTLKKMFYILGKGNQEKVTYILGSNLKSLKIKKFLYFSL